VLLYLYNKTTQIIRYQNRTDRYYQYHYLDAHLSELRVASRASSRLLIRISRKRRRRCKSLIEMVLRLLKFSSSRRLSRSTSKTFLGPPSRFLQRRNVRVCVIKLVDVRNSRGLNVTQVVRTFVARSGARRRSVGLSLRLGGGRSQGSTTNKACLFILAYFS